MNENKTIVINESIAADDSGMVQFWCEGHFSSVEFIESLKSYLNENGYSSYIPFWMLSQLPHVEAYQTESEPEEGNYVIDVAYVVHDSEVEGSIPITYIDFWFPMS